MAAPESIIMYAVVAGVGLPAAIYNRTAFALVATWLLGFVAYKLTGDNLPLLLYFALDYVVLLAIFTKPETRDLSPYRTFADQVRALWQERCPSDVIIAAIFFLMWTIYIVDIGDFYRWWALWGLVQLQFFAAGWGAYRFWKAARRNVNDRESPGLFKLGLAGYG